MCNFRSGGFVLRIQNQLLSLMELELHGPCVLVLRLLHMHSCRVTLPSTFCQAGSERLGRAELLAELTDFGT